MAIDRDAASESGVSTAGTHTWDHTPVGTPRGVMVFVVQRAAGGADEVTGVTYGGQALTRIDFASDPAGETVKAWSYFLGTGIPTGTQSVVVSAAGATVALRCACVTATAGADTEVAANGKIEADVDDPAIVLATGAGVSTVVAGAISSGVGDVANIAPNTGYTDIVEFDFAAQVGSIIWRDAVATGGNVTIGWATSAEEDVAAVGLAIKEVAGGGGLSIPIAMYHRLRAMGV